MLQIWGLHSCLWTLYSSFKTNFIQPEHLHLFLFDGFISPLWTIIICSFRFIMYLKHSGHCLLGMVPSTLCMCAVSPFWVLNVLSQWLHWTGVCPFFIWFLTFGTSFWQMLHIPLKLYFVLWTFLQWDPRRCSFTNDDWQSLHSSVSFKCVLILCLFISSRGMTILQNGHFLKLTSSSGLMLWANIMCNFNGLVSLKVLLHWLHCWRFLTCFLCPFLKRCFFICFIKCWLMLCS